ncbi:MAG TPA: sensor histidine kinase [Candidatus Deferrimicrobium sp.]|nr:sensor histidine kinase [Candidatus Deferrimicrobium sp.]
MKSKDAEKKDAVAAAIVEERLRLSRELHDRALQLLTSARLRLENCHYHQNSDAALEKELRVIEDNLDHAITEIRNILAETQTPEQLQAGSLERRLKEELSIFSARNGLQIDLHCAVDAHDLPIAIEKELYFALREGVLNAVRHARASEIHLSLARSQSAYRATLSDNGVGFSAADTEGSNHYGLKGMKERIVKLGGTLDLQTAPGQGTRIEIEIPYSGD